MEHNSLIHEHDLMQPSVFISNPLPIFEIPLILDLICEKFLIKDFANCRVVCKLFLSVFNPYFWKKIDWRRASNNTTWDTIARNSFLFKDLTVRPWDIAIVGDDQLVNLSTLYIHRRLYKDEIEDHNSQLGVQGTQATDGAKQDRDRFLSMIHEAEVNGKDVGKTISTLLLVKKNPGLRHLSIDITNWLFPLIFGSNKSPNFEDSRHQSEDSFLYTLKNHPSLVSLKVNYGFVGNSATIATIIRHCPYKTLQSLEISRLERPSNFDMSSSNSLNPDPELSKNIEWPLFLALTSIKISYPVTQSMMQVFIQLLKTCPNLIKFELCSVPLYQHKEIYDTITTYCPKLEEFPMPGYIADYDGVSKFLASMSNWREIRLGIIDQRTDVIIPSFLQSSWATIETIIIAGISNVSSKTVARILAECVVLKHLSLEGYDETQKCGITLSDLAFTPWVSCEIRYMKLDIMPSCPTDPTKRTPHSQQEIVGLLMSLVPKIEQLRDPKLDFTWPTEYFIPIDDVKSLSNGEITEDRLGRIGLIKLNNGVDWMRKAFRGLKLRWMEYRARTRPGSLLDIYLNHVVFSTF